MFNMYTKLTTALGAFALLFSSAAWGQCDEGQVAVDYTVGGGAFTYEITYALNNADGETVLSGGSANEDGSCIYGTGYVGDAGSICLAPGEYTLLMSDCYGDGWNGNAAVFTVAGIEIANLTITGDDCPGFGPCSASATFTVSNDLPGCTDESASNYNPAATVDDGSCCLDNLITITLFDQFNDGWTYAGVWGGFILDGDSIEVAGGDTPLSVELCLPTGCYIGEVSMGAYGQEASWEITDASGALITSGSGQGGFGTTFGTLVSFYAGDNSCVAYGCIYDDACNYNADANFDDGSCEYETCAGCTDEGACNFDAEATYDDGTECDYSCVGCLDSTALNYDEANTIACDDCCLYCDGEYYSWIITDSYGDGLTSFSGDGSYLVQAGDSIYAQNSGYFGDGYTPGGISETAQFCVPAGTCVYAVVNTDDYAYETSFSLTNLGTNEVIFSSDDYNLLDYNTYSYGSDSCVFGCTDASACNYDASADIDDESCDYSCIGCQDSSAANYDPNATLPGDCVYCDAGTFILTVDMTDSFGDGWNTAEYYIFNNTSGALEDSGSIQTAFTGDGLSVGTDYVCLAPGCYNFEVTADNSFSPEVGVDLTDQFGTSYASLGDGEVYQLDFTLTGQCGFEGCTDPAGLNFDPSASVDDGDCQIPPANNDAADAEALACGLSATGTLEYATDNEGLDGTSFGNDDFGAAGVWYVINSDADQQITVSTCDTPSNDGDTDYAAGTDIGIFTLDMAGDLTCIATNNDGCESGNHSTIAWSAMTGMDYYIRVEGFGGNDFVISAACDASITTSPSNDDCDGAIAQVTGETFVGNLCGANAEALDLPWEGNGTPYAVYFTFNSANYDTFLFNLTNANDDPEATVGFAMLTGNACDELGPFVGCVVTGTCAGSVEGFLPELDADTDYYFVVWTDDQSTCGDFEFTTTGIILGCTDATADNYNPEANQDDSSCTFTNTPANDECSGAIALECNSIVTGSTGGATVAGAPNGVADCAAAPGPGVWYSFVGDGQLHNLSTCGSAIDSKINVYSADTLCGGGGVNVPPMDACDSLVTVNYTVGGGAWDSEITWSIVDADSVVVASGAAPAASSVCLAEGDYTLNMIDSYGDGWNGASASFSDALGGDFGTFTLESDTLGTATISVSAYSMEPIYIAGDFTCVATAEGNDGSGACTLFDADDVDVSFISQEGLLYYVYVGSTGAAGTFDLTFDCAPVVEGCTNVYACDYNELANVDTGCDFYSCVECAAEENVVLGFNMVDSYGDSWNGAEYIITDFENNVVATGTLDQAGGEAGSGYAIDNDNYIGAEFGWDYFCLAPACYQITVTGGSFPSEVSWSLVDADGNVLASGTPTEDFFGNNTPVSLSLGDAICGCTDTGACNYDETATAPDGSCDYESCAGCTDAGACNYDDSALIEDGSCCYDNCFTINMEDSWGDGWNGFGYVISTVDGVEVASGGLAAGSSGSDSYCLADGCYMIEVGPADEFYCCGSEISWDFLAFGGIVQGGAMEYDPETGIVLPGQAVTFNIGSGDACVVGCDVPSACNYNADTNIGDITLCQFDGCSGCTYETATNYDEGSVIDDGSCNFEIANPCPADLNGDGSVSTADLLEFLTAFGQEC